jgi:GntR family transcriptional regulator
MARPGSRRQGGTKLRRIKREAPVDYVISDFVPRYYQVYVVLQQRIREGEWSSDAAMPTEQEFAAKFGVSRVTIRKALNMLQAEKLVLRQQGRGTFALPPARNNQRANFSGLLENIVDFEFHTKVRVLAFAKVTLPGHVARLLECRPGAIGLEIVRVRSDSEAPFSHTTCYLPEPEADLVSRESLGNRTVIATLAAAGVIAATAEQRLSATIADVDVAKLLRLDVGAPLISMTRVVRNEQGRPFELIRALYRPDKYEYRVNLARERGGDAPRWTVTI